MDKPPPLKTQSLESKVLLKDRQILKLFQLRKKSKGQQKKGYFSLFSFPSFILSGKNNYHMDRFVFIQTKIMKTKDKEQTPNIIKDQGI